MKLFWNILLLLTALFVASCERSPLTSESEKLDQTVPFIWSGKWVDETGYWIKIEEVGDTFSIERSGEASNLQLVSVSTNPHKLIYTEEGGGVRYKHTLTAIERNIVQDEWLDLDSGEVWQVQNLKRIK